MAPISKRWLRRKASVTNTWERQNVVRSTCLSRCYSRSLKPYEWMRENCLMVYTANHGKQCVLATGDTHSKKEFLRKAGLQWDGSRKVWWRYADAA